MYLILCYLVITTCINYFPLFKGKLHLKSKSVNYKSAVTLYYKTPKLYTVRKWYMIEVKLK